jgi:hypothetical protein
MEEMMLTLKKRRSDVRGVLVFGLLALIVQTAMISHALLVQRVLDVGREWGVFLMLGTAWIAIVVVALQFRRHLLAYPDPFASTPATLQALLDENRTAMARSRFMGWAGLLFAATTGLTLGQLVAVDKMTLGNVRDFSIVFAGGMLIGTAYGIWRYFRVLKPEGQRIERLLADYRS